MTLNDMGLDWDGHRHYLIRCLLCHGCAVPSKSGPVLRVRPYAAETDKTPSGPEGSSGMPGLQVP